MYWIHEAIVAAIGRGDDRREYCRDQLPVVNTQGDAATIEQAIVQATRLRIVAAMQIISIKNKLNLWGLDGRNKLKSRNLHSWLLQEL